MLKFRSRDKNVSNGYVEDGDKKPFTALHNRNSPHLLPISADSSIVNHMPKHDKEKAITRYNFYAEKTPVNLQWKHITLQTKERTIILNDVSGSSCSGQLTAVIGPSGSGKTSLLNVLSGFTQQRVAGQVLINGAKREMRKFRKMSTYLFQDACVLPQFTIRELVTFAARLKISSTGHEKNIEKAIDDCIHILGLTAQQNQRANTLSGGERKRLCIAQEIVSNPPLLFLDEPTSGLDSSSCFKFIKLLKSLAEAGRNIICTIHQPSSRIYEMFDNLYMMSDGVCIYRGSTENLLPFLADKGFQCPSYYNPTDYITNIAIGIYGDHKWTLKTAMDALDDVENFSRTVNVCDTVNKEGNNIQNLLDSSCNGYPASYFSQFQVLFKRNFLSAVREPLNLPLRILTNFLNGIFMGYLFYNTGNDFSYLVETIGLLDGTLYSVILFAQMPAVLTFPLRRTIFEREHLNGWYSTLMYYFAMAAAELPFLIILPILNIGILYWSTGQPNEMTRFGLFLLSVAMLSIIAESIGLMIGMVTSVSNGLYISLSITTLGGLFGGALLPLRHIPLYLRWLPYFCYYRYGFQSVLINLYSEREDLNCSKNFCFISDTKKILEQLDMDGSLCVDYCALLGFLIFFRIASFLMLYYIAERKR